MAPPAPPAAISDLHPGRSPFLPSGCRGAPGGFTLVEVLVALAIGVFLLAAIGQALGFLGWQFRRGSGDLQNLQEARLALAALRRDFAGAVPRLSATGSAPQRERTRRFPITAPPPGPTAGSGSAGNAPVRLLPDGIEFQVGRFDSPADELAPRLDPVRYTFDAKAGTLERTTPAGTTRFRGIREVQFEVFAHAANPDVPLLWVRLVTLADEGAAAGGQPLELATTMASRFIASDRRTPSWNLSSLAAD